MKRIYKYPVSLADSFNVFLPTDAQVLTVQVQYDKPQMWVLLAPEEMTVSREFCLIDTSRDIPDADNLQYIGTFQLQGGALVFHLFERRRTAS